MFFEWNNKYQHFDSQWTKRISVMSIQLHELQLDSVEHGVIDQIFRWQVRGRRGPLVASAVLLLLLKLKNLISEVLVRVWARVVLQDRVGTTVDESEERAHILFVAAAMLLMEVMMTAVVVVEVLLLLLLRGQHRYVCSWLEVWIVEHVATVVDFIALKHGGVSAFVDDVILKHLGWWVLQREVRLGGIEVNVFSFGRVWKVDWLWHLWIDCQWCHRNRRCHRRKRLTFWCCWCCCWYLRLLLLCYDDSRMFSLAMFVEMSFGGETFST